MKTPARAEKAAKQIRRRPGRPATKTQSQAEKAGKARDARTGRLR